MERCSFIEPASSHSQIILDKSTGHILSCFFGNQCCSVGCQNDSTLNIQHTTFQGCSQGLDVFESKAKILNCQFYEAKNRVVQSRKKSIVEVIGSSIVEFGETAFYCEEESETRVSHSKIKSNDPAKQVFVIVSQAKLFLSDIQVHSKSLIDFRQELANASSFKIEDSTLNDLRFPDFEKK